MSHAPFVKMAETLIICTRFSPRSRLYGEVMTDVANRLTTSFTHGVTIRCNNISSYRRF